MKDALEAKAVEILEASRDVAIATIRPDGFPQNTTVSFVHDGLTLFIGVGSDSQKARNMRRDSRVSLTLTPPYSDWNHIRGLSMAAKAAEMTTAEESAEIVGLMLKRFPQIANMAPMEGVMPAFFRLTPTILSVLDYSLGFGHTDTFAVDDTDIAESLDSMKHKWLLPI
jgi:Pyridoxamine 5'-phosphate oxidase